MALNKRFIRVYPFVKFRDQLNEQNFIDKSFSTCIVKFMTLYGNFMVGLISHLLLQLRNRLIKIYTSLFETCDRGKPWFTSAEDNHIIVYVIKTIRLFPPFTDCWRPDLSQHPDPNNMSNIRRLFVVQGARGSISSTLYAVAGFGITLLQRFWDIHEIKTK